MVSGSLEPDAGTVKPGASLKLGYFARQSLDLLDPFSSSPGAAPASRSAIP
jgi:hypothetical protein